MRFEDFIKEGKVRKAKPDYQLVKSLIKSAEEDLSFLGSLPVNDHSARKVMISYYDTLRSVIEAMASLSGYKVYSHEAFVYFLEIKEEMILARKFNRFIRLRNKLNYYGSSISSWEVKENIAEIKEIIKRLKDKYLKEVKK